MEAQGYIQCSHGRTTYNTNFMSDKVGRTKKNREGGVNNGDVAEMY